MHVSQEFSFLIPRIMLLSSATVAKECSFINEDYVCYKKFT